MSLKRLHAVQNHDAYAQRLRTHSKDAAVTQNTQTHNTHLLIVIINTMASKIPQPPAWPLIGNLLDMDAANPVQSFNRLADEYGKACTAAMSVAILADVS